MEILGKYSSTTWPSPAVLCVGILAVMSAATIMIVDDTSENRRVLEGILTEHGYKVRPASNGAFALKSAQVRVLLRSC